MSAVISAISLESPVGTGLDSFRTAVRTGIPAPYGVIDGIPAEPFADPSAAPTRPIRLADRPSAMAIRAIETLLDDDIVREWPPGRRALVLGSGAAGIDQSMTLTGDSLTRPRPDNVNPALVPACVMNYAASQAAIRFDLRGPNATVTAGRATGLAVLRYAWRLLARDRADAVLCGAYEDLNERRLAIAEAAGLKTRHAEGCVVFLVESASRARAHRRPVLAEILAVRSGVFADPRDAPDVLNAAVRGALDDAGAAAADIRIVAPFGEEDADLPLPARPRVLRCTELIGDTFGAAAAFQMAAAIAVAHRNTRRPSPGRLALITTIDPDGHAGCCLLRIADHEGPGA